MTIRDINPPISTASNIREFIKSRLHVDFEQELEYRIEHMRDALEASEEVLTDNITHEMTRGAIKALRDLKNLFNDILISAEDNEEVRP